MSPETLNAPCSSMTLADFTSLGLMVPHLRGEDVASVIQELARLMQVENRVPDLLPFFQTALNREFMVSTDIVTGMALPHARVPGLKEVSFALGRTTEPLRWGPSPARSVRLVSLIAVPATDATQYLLLISALVRLSRNSGLVARLNAAQDTSQMLEVLAQVSLRAISPVHRASIAAKSP